MASQPNQVVSKQAISAAVWGGISVTDDSLVQCISDIRRVLGKKNRQLLKTIPRQGYSLTVRTIPVIQLPGDLLPFFGRQQALAEVRRMLADPGCRLLVILGLGGVGKSRLAKVVGKQHAEQFRDGVFFVELTALQQAELIPETIAHAIHAPLQGVRSPIKQLISVLQRREVLLILDNIEHLLPEVQFCLTLLESCPELKIMFTSREPVQLYGEWTYHLQGLPVPAEADDPSSWGSESAAYGLFVQSAKRVNHHFKPSAQDKQHILGICRLVDGMPLGIEIAASLAQHLTCEEILLELRESLLPRRLHDERGSRSSLAGVLQQSWDMLTTREQQVMQHLSLFRGEFNREAASAIAGVTMADYGGLISKSMLSRNPGGIIHCMRSCINTQPSAV